MVMVRYLASKLKRSFEFNTYDFRFFGYFTEAVSGEPRNRYVHLLYHLEDDTISLLGNYSFIPSGG